MDMKADDFTLGITTSGSRMPGAAVAGTGLTQTTADEGLIDGFACC